MRVGVLEHFDSSHHLPGHPKCGTPHGHTYKVEATVEAPVVRGMVIDFDDLKSALREILAEYDHADLNGFIANPTCENIAAEIHRKLRRRVKRGKIAVRVWEGEGKWAECLPDHRPRTTGHRRK